MIALDIETTGVNSRKHSILSIGALDFNEPENQFYAECRAWDGAHFDEEAFTVNGFSEEAASDPTKQSEADAVFSFITWAKPIRDWMFLGQNPSFDRDFLIAACERAGMNFPFAHRTVDTHSLTFMHMVQHNITPPFDEKRRHSMISLDGALHYVGIPGEPKPHNALMGAKCHAEVASRILYNKPLLSDFSAQPMPF